MAEQVPDLVGDGLWRVAEEEFKKRRWEGGSMRRREGWRKRGGKVRRRKEASVDRLPLAMVLTGAYRVQPSTRSLVCAMGRGEGPCPSVSH